MTQAQQPSCDCVTTCGDCRNPGEKCRAYKLLSETHPDDAAVDALAALMKAKLAKQRAKGYSGWADKAQCSQQHLSNLMRNHVDKGDPVDVANFCAMLSARGEGIAAAPQAVQAAVPMFWVRLCRDGLYEGPVHNNSSEGKLLRDEKPGEWHPLYLHEAPAHPAEGVPALEVTDAMALAFHHALTDGSIGADDLEEIKIGLRAVLANVSATQPAAQGMDARQWLQQRDFEALERFAETSEDDESYDIGKEAVQRLAHFGCLNSSGFGRYSITSFGSYVLNNWSLARELPFKMQSERDAEHRAALAAQAKQGGA